MFQVEGGMKVVHLMVFSKVSHGLSSDAEMSWRENGIIPYQEKLCNGLMLLRKNQSMGTFDKSEVTCKNCLKKINGRIVK